MNSLQDLSQQIKELDVVIEEQTHNRQKLAFERIRLCSHDLIYHNEKHHSATCCYCGLSVRTGKYNIVPSSTLFKFHDKPTITKNFDNFEPIRYTVEEEMLDAMRFPKRFALSYLEKMFHDSPWTVEEVEDARGEFVYAIKQVYTNYSDWYSDQLD